MQYCHFSFNLIQFFFFTEPNSNDPMELVHLNVLQLEMEKIIVPASSSYECKREFLNCYK